jgi:4-amino-4-deoxy-L-arabinose transferase-like glycosyltransferase
MAHLSVAKTTSIAGTVQDALLRLIDALCDPARRNRTMLKLTVGYAVVWGLYAVVAKSSQALNADMAEMVLWGQNLALGYPKHPPLMGWVAGAWFAIFPRADWAMYLLSAINLGVGLYICFLLAGEWLDGPKRAVVPFVLALIPFYNFLGLKFDQNSFLIPLWALTIWAFVRSLETRHVGYAALAGIAGAAAMLTKYWSAFLVLSLFLAALADNRRNAYFRSTAPWVSILAATVLLMPHLAWLIDQNFPPMRWVTPRRAVNTPGDALHSYAKYVASSAAYAGVAFFVAVAAVRPSLVAWRDIIWPGENFRRVAVVLFWVPLLVPILVATPLHLSLLAIWNTPAVSLLPVVLLASPLVTLTRNAAAFIAGIAITIALGSLLVSPVVSAVILKRGVENHAAYAQEAAAKLEGAWRREVNLPLRIIGGPFPLISTASFYIADKPKTYANFSKYLSPWVGDNDVAQQGIAVICPNEDPGCFLDLDPLAGRSPGAKRSEITLTPRWLGLTGAPQNFTILVVPPRG